jgi:hypothetical protein
MKKKVIIVSAVCGLFAGASAQAAQPLQHIVFHDNEAIVSFDSSSPITCADGTQALRFSHVTINGFQVMNKNNGSGVNHSNTMVVVVFQQNQCTGDFVFGAGDVDGGYTQSALQSGTLSGTVTLVDFNTGAVDGTATVNMTLTATGPVSTQMQHLRFSLSTPTGPIVETVHSNNKSVNATVAGGMSFNGVAIPLPTPDLIFSQLGTSKAGVMDLQK